ncbi:MAG: SPFH domain-containing protein [Myxococcales bacterium]|nr:SPFH domain-containing protein [Myxococcales bacterium]MDP3502573.1 SPFH domain-containing protein [Myxococcales bacterium]
MLIITGFIIGLVLAVLWSLRASGVRVPEGHLGVITRFGAAERDAGGTLTPRAPGLHLKWPWERVVLVSMMEQKIELAGEGAIRTMAADGTALRLDAALRYQPNKTMLDQFLFGLQRPAEHVSTLFTCLLRNELANVQSSPTPSPHSQSVAEALPQEAGSYALIRRERGLLSTRIADFCRARIGSEHGIDFNAVDLTDILPPDELRDALNAVMQARSSAEAHHYRAESECRQQVLEARQGVSIATARAQAAAQELRTLSQALAELEKKHVLGDYVRRRKAEVLAESRLLYVNERSGESR